MHYRPPPIEVQPDWFVGVPSTLLVLLVLGGLVVLFTLFARRKSWVIAGTLGIGLFLLLFFGLPLFLWFSLRVPSIEGINAYPDRSSREVLPPRVDFKEPSAPTSELGDPATEKDAAAADTASSTTGTPSTSSQKNKPLPEWVTSPPKRVGTVYRRVIQSDPFTTVDECYVQLDQVMMRATSEYLDQLIGQHQLASMGITPGYIRQNICRDEYVEQVDVRSLAVPMKQVYLLMEFDDGVQQDLRRRWKESLLGQRLAMVGVGSGLILLVVGLVFSFFKLDTATKGFYTKRLIFGAVTVTIVAVLIAANVLEGYRVL